MAIRSRYQKYVETMKNIQKEKDFPVKASTGESILRKLKKLKGQEFVMAVPIGGTDGK